MAIDHPAAARLKDKFPGVPLLAAQFKGQVQIAVPAARFLEIVTFLKNDPALGYDMLSDVSCVDYLNYPGRDPAKGRFGLVYIFNSIEVGKGAIPNLILRVFLDAPDLQIASLVPLYAGAEWLEREVFDMFGITFVGHPDLRRILTWDSFVDHPLRKDYPVTGKGEREDFQVLTRESV
jgi:NADH-quinone oxidoreductase subunit C